MNRLPSWFHQELPSSKTSNLAHDLKELGIHTVCQEARCPNIPGCFERNQATFIILGNICTRNCKFCAVKKDIYAQLSIDLKEPMRIAEAVKIIGMPYVVVTSVTRDDLPDGGADIFAKTINSIRKLNENTKVEVLIPDLKGEFESLRIITETHPDAMAHNIETIERLYQDLRPMADYKVSLRVIRNIKILNASIITKSSLMLGLGETKEEVIKAMRDLRQAHCDILVLGQYLAPSSDHYPVKRFISPEEFNSYKEIGTKMGFGAVFSAPLARSSFCAEQVFNEGVTTCMI